MRDFGRSDSCWAIGAWPNGDDSAFESAAAPGDRVTETPGFRDALLQALPSLNRFAARWTNTGIDRDDLVQATCERALSNRDSWRPGSRMDSWLFRIAQNLAIDSARGQRRRHLALARQMPLVADLNDGRTTTGQRLELKDVRKVLETLADDQQEVIEAVCINGLSYAEAAQKLNIPRGTVMSRLYRGRTQLHIALGTTPDPKDDQ